MQSIDFIVRSSAPIDVMVEHVEATKRGEVNDDLVAMLSDGCRD